MTKISQDGLQQSITPKFPKSISLTSLRTQPESAILKQRGFSKVRQDQKKALIQLITLENYTMKKAAKHAKMSYSTAKKIVSRFRQALRVKFQSKVADLDLNNFCCYREIQPQQSHLVMPIPIFVTIASQYQISIKNIVLTQTIDC